VTTYTVPGDEERLDRIARAIYGSERGGTVEALLEANPGLAAHGPFVPGGTVIEVPPAPEPVVATVVRPWE